MLIKVENIFVITNIRSTYFILPTSEIVVKRINLLELIEKHLIVLFMHYF